MTGDRSDLFSRPSTFAVIGMVIVAVTFAGLGGWAAIARIDAAVIAPGLVTTVERGQRLQHLEGGIVDAVLVTEGDVVEAGDVLVRLNTLQLFSDRSVLRERVAVGEARVARLSAERTGAEAVEFPDGVPEDIADRELRQFEDRRSVLLSSLEIFDQRSIQVGDEIAGLREQADALRERLILQSEMLSRMEDGSERGVVEANRVVVQRDLAIQIRASLGQIASDIAAAQSDALSIVAEAARLRREYSERAAAELSEVQETLNTHRNELVVIEDALSRADMRAPVSGRVQEVAVAAGDVIQPGQVLMEITPRTLDFLVTARISPLDIESVHIDQRVELRFSSYNVRRMTPAFGNVLTVSDSAVPATREGEEPHFIARIEVDAATLPDEIASSVSYGMPVEVFLLRGERSVLRYLADPVLDALTRSLRESD